MGKKIENMIALEAIKNEARHIPQVARLKDNALAKGDVLKELSFQVAEKQVLFDVQLGDQNKILRDGIKRALEKI